MNIHAFVLLVFICTRYGCDAGKKDKTSSKLCQSMLENMKENSESVTGLQEQLKDLKDEMSNKLDTLHTAMRSCTHVLPSNVNLALNKPATQSTTSIHQGTAERANDGNKDGNWGSRSCTHTNPVADSWWKVDLKEEFPINKVVITNRKDCCGERLHDLILTVSKTTNGEEVECGRYKGPSTNGAIETIQCAPGTVGRFLKIRINGPNEGLTLCEVEVY